jgi:hypothetical protein
MVLTIDLAAASEGPLALSVIDNLIVVHNLTQQVLRTGRSLLIYQVSLIFDIKLRTPSERCIHFPVAAPLPLSPYYVSGYEQMSELNVLCLKNIYSHSHPSRQRLGVLPTKLYFMPRYPLF